MAEAEIDVQHQKSRVIKRAFNYSVISQGGLFMYKVIMEDSFSLRDNIAVHSLAEDKHMLTNSCSGDVFEINNTSKLIIDGIVENKTTFDIWKTIHAQDKEENITIEDISSFIEILLENEICILCNKNQ